MAAIASSPAVLESEKQWAPQYLDHLKELFPQGRLEGRHFRIGNDGESGRRLAFNTEDGSWTDFGDDDNRGKGLFTFMGMIEGWDGIRRLSRQEFCNLDIPLYLDHTQARLHSAFDYAEKRGMEVVRRWEYNDSDGVLLGVRIRMEDKVSREKEFVTMTYRTAHVREHRGKKISITEGWNVVGGWGPIAPFYGEDLIAGDRTKPILVCEGEKATDAARGFFGETHRCVTWGGGSTKAILRASWDLLRDQETLYWPDKDLPGQKSAEKLTEKMKWIKVVPVFQSKELKEADDLADVEGPGAPEWAMKLLEQAGRISISESQAEILRYTYIINQDQFFDRQTYSLKTHQQVTRSHAHQADKLADELLSDPTFKRVESMTFAPGKGEFVMERMNGSEVECVNRWKRNDLQAELGLPDKFIRHMEYLIPDDEIRELILDYMGFYVQHPGEKIHSAIVLQGMQGTGKSYILEVLKRVIGSHLVKEITTDMLRRDFNSWMEDAQIIAVEEIMAGGKMEITNKLKPLITSPTASINSKGQKEYEIPNRANFIFFTNHEYSLHLDDGDRRFMVYFSPVHPKTEPGYYEDLFDDLDLSSGKILNLLLNRDLSKFNAKAPARMTEAKQSIIDRSKSSLEVEIQERISEKIAPFDMDVVSLMDITDWARSMRLINQFQTSMIVAAAMKKVGCLDLGTKEINKENRRVWAVRNIANYSGASTEKIVSNIRDINSAQNVVESKVNPEDDAGKGQNN
jgi:hypothetical protein